MINKNNFILTLTIVLIILLLGGTSAFAERALPGDLLYGIKISINESVAGIFAWSREEKTEWKERLVERRLKEAHKLVLKNNLSEETRIILADKIFSQIEDFNKSINELALDKNESVNSSNINIRMQASLAAYISVLENLLGGINIDVNTKKETEKLIVAIKEYENKVKGDNKNIELSVGADGQIISSVATPADSTQALAKQTAAENLLSSTKLLYQKEKVNLSTNIQTQLDSKFALIEVSLKDGKAFMASSDYTNAIEKFQMVISGANSVKLLMLSNVIKEDIEDDMGIEDSNEDIEDENLPDSSELESINDDLDNLEYEED